MSSSDAFRAPVSRRTPRLAALLLALALPALGGCGFKPVYGTGASAPVQGQGVQAALAQVSIDVIPDRNGQVLRNLLIDRFYGQGRPENPDYRLAVALTAAKEDLGIRKDATATRARVRLVADYQLIDTKTGKTLYRTFSRAIVSYNLLEAQYATLVAEQNAYERALTELSEDIRTRLSLYFQRGRK
ncbi:MAG TPA: LPS assembly lipoprotein LptE [Azospirillaceae bacterium]|nr:LPS assembly lipoprotein LptE [Azospirillaceae bacterium]